MSSHISMRVKCVRIRDTHKAIPIKDYAKSKSLTVSAIYYWLRVGDCKGYKSGGKWYIYVDDYQG